MKKLLLLNIVLALVATSPSFSGVSPAKQTVMFEEPCLFRDRELQFDAYGLGDFFRGTNRTFSGRPMWGGGLGVNYFFNRFAGIGIEQDLYGRNSAGLNRNLGITRWATIGNLFLRYPICSINLAPYLMVGGGANYGNIPSRGNTSLAGQGFGHVGGGLEYRLTENIGLFSDARYLYSDVRALPNTQLLWRYGLRFAF